MLVSILNNIFNAFATCWALENEFPFKSHTLLDHGLRDAGQGNVSLVHSLCTAMVNVTQSLHRLHLVQHVRVSALKALHEYFFQRSMWGFVISFHFSALQKLQFNRHELKSVNDDDDQCRCRVNCTQHIVIRDLWMRFHMFLNSFDRRPSQRKRLI